MLLGKSLCAKPKEGQYRGAHIFPNFDNLPCCGKKSTER